ncbi:MAG: hypothetical protein QOH88_1802 [Verrucomicrobiota bacterium]|jgi:hypothetical protein
MLLTLMALDKYDLSHEDDQWKLKQRGAERAIRSFDTKDDAKKFSTDYVERHSGSLVSRKKDDKIQEERTYPRSADPKRSRG